MGWDEPTTIPGLRESGQIDLYSGSRTDYRRDPLRAARGVIVGIFLGAAVIFAVWGLAVWLMP
jgi:hypothetical protein